MSYLQHLPITVFPALVIVAALKDVTSFTIPNWISGVLALAFFLVAPLMELPVQSIGAHVVVGVVSLMAGMAMFAAGWIGGGDAKLFAAAALWLGPEAIAPFILVTALAGGALAVVLLNLRTVWARGILPVGPGWVERLREPKGDAPYGVAIAAGALAAFPSAAIVTLATG
jgi:prepilin peptidase CpaA